MHMIEADMKTITLSFFRYFFVFLAISCLIFQTGCQLIKIEKKGLDQSLTNKTDNILTNSQLSYSTLTLLNVIDQTALTCLKQVEQCVNQLNSPNIFDEEERYAAISEIYLAKAFEIEKKYQCKAVKQRLTPEPSAQSKVCLDQQLFWLDKSLRYSYVYLFKNSTSPQTRIFDQRQMQVRTFYNVGLSRLVTSSYKRYRYLSIPRSIRVGSGYYQFDLEHYPSLKNRTFERLESSYIFNFSGFHSINRQEGLGSEFVAVMHADQPFNNNFILDPEEYFKDKPNPNIHHPRYLSISATVETANPSSSVEQILAGDMNFVIKLFNPYQYKTTQIGGASYTLTANYSVPFAMWLAENKLGSTGYLSLINRTESLRMPHLYMIEPYQPHKKIIVLIHGVASSPETWVQLTNNILGDKRLRDQFQIWQVFYSTNMPIFESRFQINSLLKQAFAQTIPNSDSAHNAVVIGHSMGGIISRLLVSDVNLSQTAIPLMNYEQYIQYQQHPIIQERFIFKSELPFTRAIFIAAPHRGTDYANRWHTQLIKKFIKLPNAFSEQVDIPLKNIKSTMGLVHSGPVDLSPDSRFMQVTKSIMPRQNIVYHSIIGNQTNATDVSKMTDGIVPYWSSHLEGATSESIIQGGHSIHEKSETILELRRILRSHLEQTNF